MNTNVNTKGLTISKLLLTRWRRFIEDELGFVLPKRQEYWLKQAIIGVAQAEQLSPQILLQSCIDGDDNSELRQQVFDAVLIAESRFFRHIDSLEFIGKRAKQARLDALALSLGAPINAKSAYKVWSVGCSRGQEPWSLAMLLDNLLCPFEIYGSDASLQVLNDARVATYSKRELADIPQAYYQYTILQQDTFLIDQQLRGSVNFIHHNLISSDKLFDFLVDTIICQNVLIYFRQFDQRDILANFVEQLTLGGYLVLAPGEAVQWQHPKMRRVNDRSVNAWQKIK